MWRCVERLVGCSLAVVATVSVASAQEAGAEERVAVSLDRAVAVAAAGATFDETQTLGVYSYLSRDSNGNIYFTAESEDSYVEKITGCP